MLPSTCFLQVNSKQFQYVKVVMVSLAHRSKLCLTAAVDDSQAVAGRHEAGGLEGRKRAGCREVPPARSPRSCCQPPLHRRRFRHTCQPIGLPAEGTGFLATFHSCAFAQEKIHAVVVGRMQTYAVSVVSFTCSRRDLL